MIQRKIVTAISLTLQTPLYLFGAPHLLAQQTQSQLDEIVVTAQRRETNLQETPMSIQAFSMDELASKGIENGSELGIMVPNVVLNPGLTTKLRIRPLSIAGFGRKTFLPPKTDHSVRLSREEYLSST